MFSEPYQWSWKIIHIHPCSSKSKASTCTIWLICEDCSTVKWWPQNVPLCSQTLLNLSRPAPCLPPNLRYIFKMEELPFQHNTGATLPILSLSVHFHHRWSDRAVSVKAPDTPIKIISERKRRSYFVKESEPKYD